MTIEKQKALTFLKECNSRYGGVKRNPGDNYRRIDLFSEDGLPISTVKEYEIAAKIAKKYDLRLIDQDFSAGEGLQPFYQPVFAVSCFTFDELSKAKEKLQKAKADLEQELQKI